MSLAQDIARRMLERRAATASAKAAPKPALVVSERPSPAQAAKLIARQLTSLISKPAPVAAKSAETLSAPCGSVDQTPLKREPENISAPPRVVSTPPRHRSAPYNPPKRAEPDITALVEAFAPPSPQPSPLPPPVLAPGFRGSCKAVCATTGRQCRLPAHDMSTEHRNERGPFVRVAAPGTTSFPLREALDRAATHQPDVDVLTATRSSAQEQREFRSRRERGTLTDAIAKRKSAHAGDDTTVGDPSIDSPAANTTPTNTTEAP